MPANSRRLLGLAVAIPLLAIACHHDREANASKTDINGGSFVARDTARPLGPGDIRITNRDSSVEVALIGDSLVAGLGQRVLNEVRAHTDTTKVTGNGFAAGIERAVKGTVASAISRQLEFPLRDVSDVRYENGRLVFYGTDGKRMHLFENSDRDRDETDHDFRPDDAQRFIAAFKAKKARAG